MAGGGRYRCRRHDRQFFRRNSGDFLESLSKFGEAFRIDRVLALAVNLFQLSGQLSGAALVARAEIKVEQALERGSVPRRALQNVFEKVRGLLRQPVA